MARHKVSGSNHKEILKWLIQNVQENFYEDDLVYDTKSDNGAIFLWAEWRSKDQKSWVLQTQHHRGLEYPKTWVEIKDPKLEMIFLLMWT